MTATTAPTTADAASDSDEIVSGVNEGGVNEDSARAERYEKTFRVVEVVRSAAGWQSTALG
ncbi:hypothetical protein [Streptoalloteichus hindustanus]|uniref:Uncharacterized protein n=1 Tax=Streptoalloteichus hindustanus TaxID=2017 RepID=A0A1M4Z0L2_STRHI|nr:hypothetical protein [Streptoalloteichus hindustanus]SHF11488.1 hypothetical protein SAMN05444320_102555 [Streptoalloteichus hindustanus]